MGIFDRSDKMFSAPFAKPFVASPSEKKVPFIAAPKEGKSLCDFNKYGLGYFLNGALAGGICCSVTHGGMCPVDVLKTRIQLDPVTYNQGLVGGFRQVIAAEGTGALATGLGPTAVGYFIQGWFKFGGFEFFKINFAKKLGDQGGWDNRNFIYLGASACAEFIADIFLCPLESARIRQVSDPTFEKSLIPAIQKLYAMEGIAGWYAGFVPMVFKQVPYTMAKFAVQGVAAEALFGMLPDRKSLSRPTKMGVSIFAGEIGFVNLATVGLPARCVMIGTLTAGQFVIFDSLMPLLGAEKFHFSNPAGGGH